MYQNIQGKFYMVPPYEEELQVVNGCWERHSQFAPGTGSYSHTHCPIQGGQPWTTVHTKKLDGLSRLYIHVCILHIYIHTRQLKILDNQNHEVWEGDKGRAGERKKGQQWCRCSARIWSSLKKIIKMKRDSRMTNTTENVHSCWDEKVHNQMMDGSLKKS